MRSINTAAATRLMASQGRVRHHHRPEMIQFRHQHRVNSLQLGSVLGISILSQFPHCDPTAVLAAAARALGGADPHSKRLVNAVGGVSTEGFPKPLVDRVVAGVTLRTRFVDRCVESEIESGTRQVVVLGSGLDTLAWRLPWPSGCTVWALDRAGTAGVASQALGAPPSVKLIDVEADLTESDWLDRLTQAGVDWSLPTIFVAEALLLYLPSDIVHQVMSTTSLAAAPGSAFVYTYLGEQGEASPTTEALRGSIAALGEDFASSISSPEAFLVNTGWENRSTQTYNHFARSLSKRWHGDEGGGVSWLCQAVNHK